METEDKFNMIAKSIETTQEVVIKVTDLSNQIGDSKEKLTNISGNSMPIAEENTKATHWMALSIDEQTTSIHEITDTTNELPNIIKEVYDQVGRFKV